MAHLFIVVVYDSFYRKNVKISTTYYFLDFSFFMSQGDAHYQNHRNAPQGESLVVTLSSDEEEENEITYVGRARRSHGGMKMVMTVDEVLKQRKDGLSYSWKCKLGKLDA